MRGKRACITITGKVQGVFFRASTQEKARELGIVGFVKNCPDGSVYAEAEGERLEEFIQWIHQGPAAARVDEVKIQYLESGQFNSFQILR